MVGYAPPTPVPVPEEKKLEDRVKELKPERHHGTSSLVPRWRFVMCTNRC